ncbi:MAG: intrarane metalloprotease [Actinomycetospora sp.]|nr:intrarane metalloprotease [Actinomycetospora sp.]
MSAVEPGGDGPVTTVRSWVRFLAGFAVLCAVLLGTSALDATGRWGLAILAAVLVTALALETVGRRSTVVGALRRVGLGRPGGRALVVAAVVSGLVLLVFPLTAVVSGAAPVLRPGWPWLLVGVLAFHGIAEELVWRGYVFRRLRVGRTFRAATWWTMPLIAATHLPIVVTVGPAVGLGAMLVAAVTAIPLGYLYETGRNTVWAPALVHAAIDAFSSLLIVVSLTVPLLALAVPRRLLVPRDRRSPRGRARGRARRPPRGSRRRACGTGSSCSPSRC